MYEAGYPDYYNNSGAPQGGQPVAYGHQMMPQYNQYEYPQEFMASAGGPPGQPVYMQPPYNP